MPELLALPESSWSSIEKAFYCRAQAVNLQQRAELAKDLVQREELQGLARRWLALARYHESESERPHLEEEYEALPGENAGWQRDGRTGRRGEDIAED